MMKRLWEIGERLILVLIVLFAAYYLSLAMDPLFGFMTDVLNRH